MPDSEDRQEEQISLSKNEFDNLLDEIKKTQNELSKMKRVNELSRKVTNYTHKSEEEDIKSRETEGTSIDETVKEQFKKERDEFAMNHFLKNPGYSYQNNQRLGQEYCVLRMAEELGGNDNPYVEMLKDCDYIGLLNKSLKDKQDRSDLYRSLGKEELKAFSDADLEIERLGSELLSMRRSRSYN